MLFLALPVLLCLKCLCGDLLGKILPYGSVSSTFNHFVFRKKMF